MQSMGNLFTLKFWLNLRPPQMLPIYQKVFIGIIVFLLIFSFVSYFLGFKRRGLFSSFWKKLYSFSLSNFFIGLFLFFFNYELIPFLSGRFWFLLWIVIIFGWLFLIFKSLVKIPEKKKKIEEEKEYKKYIP
jgi:predicted membrane protein